MRISDWSSDVCTSDLPAIDFLLIPIEGALLISHQHAGQETAVQGFLHAGKQVLVLMGDGAHLARHILPIFRAALPVIGPAPDRHPPDGGFAPRGTPALPGASGPADPTALLGKHRRGEAMVL